MVDDLYGEIHMKEERRKKDIQGLFQMVSPD